MLITILSAEANVADGTLPQIMKDVPARPHIEFDEAGERCVGNEHAQHCMGQHGWELAKPDEDDRNDHEGGRGQGTDYIDVAGGHVEDAVEDGEAGCKEGGLAAEQHLVWTLHKTHQLRHQVRHQISVAACCICHGCRHCSLVKQWGLAAAMIACHTGSVLPVSGETGFSQRAAVDLMVSFDLKSQ